MERRSPFAHPIYELAAGGAPTAFGETRASMLPTVDYAQLERQLRALVDGEPDALANCANFAALLAMEIPALNFAGLYFLRGEDLVLGPFIGKPACTRIRVGRGVCGQAFQRDESILVDDVNAFDDHIACDTASLSELVVPLRIGRRPIGVVDCDSPLAARFTQGDRVGLERIASALAECVNLTSLLDL